MSKSWVSATDTKAKGWLEMAFTGVRLEPRLRGKFFEYDQATRQGVVLLAFFVVMVVMAEISVLGGYLVRLAVHPWLPFDLDPEHYVGIAAGILLLPVSWFAVGLIPGYGMGSIERLRLIVITNLSVFGALAAWDWLIQNGNWSRGILLSTFFFASFVPGLGVILARRWLIEKGWYGSKVVIIGATQIGRKIKDALEADPLLGLTPVGCFDDRAAGDIERRESIETEGPIARAKELWPQANSVIIAIPELGSKRLCQLTRSLPFKNVLVVSSAADFQSLWVAPQDLGGILAMRIKRNLLLKRNQIIKRIIDIVGGSFLLACAAPIILALAILIKLIDGGPAFYRQQRGVRNGKPFSMIKLRSMRVDADQILSEYLENNPEARAEWETHMKLADDPRILPLIGTPMRRWSLDELPQFYHVVSGEMSLVGPRPFPAYHLECFSDEFLELRNSVKPGITGLLQVTDRSDADLPRQEAIDTYYIRNWSLWMDLYALLQTIPAVLNGKGAR